MTRSLPILLVVALGGCSSPATDQSTQATGANPCPSPAQALTIDQPLALDHANVVAGQTLTGTVRYRNDSSAPVMIADVVIAGRPPGGHNVGGPYADLQPHHGPATLQPGDTLTVQASRTFTSDDPSGDWYSYATWQDQSGAWHDGPSVSFTVGASSSGGGGFVAAANGGFVVDGQPFRMVGANRYDLTSFPPGSGKYQCGNSYTDAQIDQSLSELVSSSGANVIRVWAFQSFTLGGSDFSTLDRIIAKASANGLKIIFALENEWTDCTEKDPASSDGRKSGSWFSTGYRAPLGAYPLAYRDYVQLVVSRYANEPTIALWQLMNEAESNDAQALHDFTVDMAQLVKKADPNHLLTLGTIGAGQAGTDNASYQQLYAIPQLDVVEAHDYGNETQALPGAPSSTANSMYADLQVAKALGKPFLVGEVGIAAPTPMYPFSYDQRAQLVDAKLQALFDGGGAGLLVWSWYDLRSDNWQGWDFGPTDPLAAVLKKHAM